MDDKPILSQERYLEILQKIKEKKEREKNKKASRDAASVTRSVPVFWLYDRGTLFETKEASLLYKNHNSTSIYHFYKNSCCLKI